MLIHLRPKSTSMLQKINENPDFSWLWHPFFWLFLTFIKIVVCPDFGTTNSWLFLTAWTLALFFKPQLLQNNICKYIFYYREKKCKKKVHITSCHVSFLFCYQVKSLSSTVTGHFTPGQFPLALSPMKSIQGNNVVWLCTKYAIDANLFRLESPILTRAKRAINRNNVGGEVPWGEVSGGNCPGGKCPRTIQHSLISNKLILLREGKLFQKK